MLGDLELRYAHLGKRKHDTPAQRASNAAAAEYDKEVWAEQEQKNAVLRAPSGPSLQIAPRYAAGIIRYQKKGQR